MKLSIATRSPFSELREAVAACYGCELMTYSHTLGPANGPTQARLMFVAEAPGRLGAARTGIPLDGDESGRRFARFLALAGLPRSDVFVTNAVLCNPIGSDGNNRPPALSEVRRCRPFLEAQIYQVLPEVVIALGRAALTALSLIQAHGLTLPQDCGRIAPWFGRKLVPLYHPGRRSTVHRPDEMQAGDWLRLGRALRGGWID